jgi:hypothetical protein
LQALTLQKKVKVVTCWHVTGDKLVPCGIALVTNGTLSMKFGPSLLTEKEKAREKDSKTD